MTSWLTRATSSPREDGDLTREWSASIPVGQKDRENVVGPSLIFGSGPLPV